jgi:outer membrane protein assembly factor BamA
MPVHGSNVIRLLKQWLALPALLICLMASPVFGQQTPQRPDRPFTELVLEGSSLFSRDDVVWLLDLREGERLPGDPGDLAQRLRERYEREGYGAVEVTAAFDSASGRLTLVVQERRVDDIEVVGVSESLATRVKQALIERVRVGDVYNARLVRRVVEEIATATEGAFVIGGDRGTGPDDIDLVERSGKHVLVVPLHKKKFDASFSTDTREDLFNPVDGFSPGLGFRTTRRDDEGLNYTFVSGYVSYKFSREHSSFSVGFERKISHELGLFAGAEVHDLTATDDAWRLTAAEQSLVSLGFKNTFRDYYRRKGVQLHVSLRPTPHHEFLFSPRWDEHNPLENATDYSFFRDDESYRPNEPILPADLNAMVFGYTYDSRGLLDAGAKGTYERHLADDLFRGSRRQDFGARIDWTSEIAGRVMGGGYTFERHILNARAYVPLSPRQSLTGRAMFGFARGTLPVERRFAIGGIGTVHGYSFKEAVGERLILLNGEYRFDLFGHWRDDHKGGLRAIVFVDSGRVLHPIGSSTNDWLNGIGVGLQFGPCRVEFGYRLDDVPRSQQVLVRFSPNF